MKIKLLDTVETKIVYSAEEKRPLEPLNDVGGSSVLLTQHVHVSEDGTKFNWENWRIHEGAEIEVGDKKGSELVGLGLAEAA